MALPDIFTQQVAGEVVGRINQLTAATVPGWGKMNASQMFAHCNVAYEMVYDDKHAKPKGLMKLILRLFVRKMVVSEKPYGRNGKTAPAFIITGPRDFEKEKARLVGYIQRTQQLGAGEFDGKMSLSFGPLSINEWNNMFYKHLDHHLTQFGV